MAKGGSGDVLSGIVAGILAQIQYMHMNTVLSELEKDEDTGDLAPRTIFRWISTNDPEAHQIKALREDYRKTKDPAILSQIRTRMDEKVRQALILIGSLNVAKAVYLHGLAGDIAASLYGQQSMIATDIINCLGEAFAVFEDEALGKFIYIQR
jgi:NAD(P)H-hydrate repair Nnr-like enzyme with NAD(P)H-hydrate dehydratase domain